MKKNIECNEVSVAVIIAELEKLFDVLNEKYFNSALLIPVITLNAKGQRKATGWCTRKKTWKDSENNYYEINICPEYVNKPIEEVCGVLLHEMVHLYNAQRGKVDCSSGSQYHNQVFNITAQQHGLEVEKCPTYGFANTSLKQKTVEFLQTLELSKFELFRDSKPKEEEKKKSSTRKYVCPKCKTSVRATKDVEIKCVKCDVKYEKV